MLADIEDHQAHAELVLTQHEELRSAAGRFTPTQGKELGREIGQLREQAIRRRDELKKAVEQQEEYETEVQGLTVMIQEAQKKLDSAPVAASSVEALKEQIAKHNVCLPTLRVD